MRVQIICILLQISDFVGGHIKKAIDIINGLSGKLAAGVSGGADSMCLLSLIIDAGRARDLTVLHVDHGIRKESARDRLLVEEFCVVRGVEFRTVCINVPALAAQNGLSIETQARESRHKFFADFCEENGTRLLLAHNKGDNVETILMHIFRGCGLRGLAGMSSFDGNDYTVGDGFCDKAVNAGFEGGGVLGNDMGNTLRSAVDRGIPNVNGKNCCLGVVRPLLHKTKNEIYQYVKDRGIPFVEDKTNFDPSYRRNHIRALIPEIEKSFPGVADAVLSLSRIATKTEEFLESQIDYSFFARDGHAVLLDKRAFDELDTKHDVRSGCHADKNHAFGVLAAEYVVRAVKMVGLCTDLEEKHVCAVLALASLENGKSIDLPRGLRAHNECGFLAFEFERPICMDILPLRVGENRLGEISVVVKEVPIIIIPSEKKGRLFVDADKLCDAGAVLRQRREGDRFHSCGGSAKKLKEYLNSKKIPNRKKDFLPLLAVGSEVLVVCGVELSDSVKITENTKRAFEIVCIQPVGDIKT